MRVPEVVATEVIYLRMKENDSTTCWRCGATFQASKSLSGNFLPRLWMPENAVVRCLRDYTRLFQRRDVPLLLPNVAYRGIVRFSRFHLDRYSETTRDLRTRNKV